MAAIDATLQIEERRGNWVRLRTLIVLRWIAIAGQLAAIVAAQRLFGIELHSGLCYLAVGASVIANLVAIFVYPENKRLSEGEVAMMLLFDIAQLAFLLFLTGGLNNPFALLILAPVTISATALQARLTLLLGAVAIVLITVVGLWHLELTDGQAPVRMPALFVFGFWVAIVIGIVFEAIYARRVTSEIASMSEALAATQMALAREQKLTDLGGVVAAAAHELGTPLATIKLVSSEMAEELADNPDLRDDARLIRDQADRCRDILRSMGRAGKDDRLIRHAPLMTVLRDAAEPHAQRGKKIVFAAGAGDGSDAQHPVIMRRPEVIHGLRNLIQNAVDFAQSTVWVDASWTAQTVTVRIVDDGPGFPANVLARIGDPFVRNRRGDARPERPEYEGMGLGLFIAKTLLERSGGELTFVNASDPSSAPAEDGAGERTGAIVELSWPRATIAQPDSDRGPLGENARIEA
ncbi:sensor histidine kinase RegB [Anianabacter salinae]|uniref:sensor histidine kinase RegB n=1 Tax=Anianabacter salinae TaxID=2851023 RepID=UPI00225E6B49|nr:ActS/PrrB/RegB family redox-sensitive histidine kinase [Anianabacter salinae]MBV0913491.1 ActS/PrrB/RegB family redox-sensitive histidine kinase [Anianabacter salinae]